MTDTSIELLEGAILASPAVAQKSPRSQTGETNPKERKRQQNRVAQRTYRRSWCFPLQK
jgi:hypothetical protein